jgi:hypothetical protein
LKMDRTEDDAGFSLTVAFALQEQPEGLAHFAGLLLEDHAAVRDLRQTSNSSVEFEVRSHLHPRRVGGVQAPVEGDGVVDVGAQRAGDVDHRHLQSGRVFPLRRVQLPLYVEVGAAHVTVDEESQVGRVDVALEVALVHLHQVVVPVFRVLSRQLFHC